MTKELLLAVGATALTLSSSQLAASSCQAPKTIAIAFSKGARCWTYQGDATHFVGNFRAGQTVIASSTGIANESDGTWEWRTTAARNVSVSAPENVHVGTYNEGKQSFRVPKTGRYTFEFSPCGMWHNLGTFVVCAK